MSLQEQRDIADLKRRLSALETGGAATGTGGGSVNTVNGKPGPAPVLTYVDVGADVAGAGAAAETYTDTQITALRASVPRIYETPIGDATNRTFTVTHGLGTSFPDVTFTHVATGAQCDVDWNDIDGNSITVTFLAGNDVPPVSSFHVKVIG